jgi:hypothetical protein
MRSILVAGAARILRVSRILRGNGTLTHYRGLRDDGTRGHRGRGRGRTDDPSAPRSPRGDHADPATTGPVRRLVIEAAVGV